MFSQKIFNYSEKALQVQVGPKFKPVEGYMFYQKFVISGKGTISNRIIKFFKISHLSTGDVLRTNIEQETPLGLEAEKYIKKGELIPDESMIQCILQELKTVKGSILLDGFPRTKIQAEKLWEVQKVSCAINLKVPYDIIIDRVKGRYVHMNSGRVYNLDFNPPKVHMKDDVTGEPLTKRPDDDPEILLNRLKVYDNETIPVLEFYKDKGILTEFEGHTSDEIWEKLKVFLVEEANLENLEDSKAEKMRF